jgi:hypothetical protein
MYDYTLYRYIYEYYFIKTLRLLLLIDSYNLGLSYIAYREAEITRL